MGPNYSSPPRRPEVAAIRKLPADACAESLRVPDHPFQCKHRWGNAQPPDAWRQFGAILGCIGSWGHLGSLRCHLGRLGSQQGAPM
eukprot:3563990-Pyramimonas_sp.AAC.1